MFAHRADFFHGLPHGLGEFYEVDDRHNARYVGEWIRGRRTGAGSLTIGGQEFRFTGLLLDDRIHGCGLLVHAGHSFDENIIGEVRYDQIMDRVFRNSDRKINISPLFCNPRV